MAQALADAKKVGVTVNTANAKTYDDLAQALADAQAQVAKLTEFKAAQTEANQSISSATEAAKQAGVEVTTSDSKTYTSTEEAQADAKAQTDSLNQASEIQKEADKTLADLLKQAQAAGLTITKDSLKTYTSIEEAKADLAKQIKVLHEAQAAKTNAENQNKANAQSAKDAQDSANQAIQDAINKEKIILKVNDRTFKLHDKVMQVRNNYDLKAINESSNDDGVYNGDIGIITEIDTNDESLKVEFDDGKIVKYKKEDIKDLDLSYAITVHKSQGSEFKCVIIPMMQVAPMLLTRNLLYTGVTRAKKLVILLGDKRFIKRMVDNNRSNDRNTNLSYWINEMESILAD